MQKPFCSGAVCHTHQRCGLTLVLNNFRNVWNGRPGVPVFDDSMTFTSEDGKDWQLMETEFIKNEFLSSLEILPSLSAAAGAELPVDAQLDGFDWWPTVRGEASSPREEMFWKRRD